MYFKETSWFSMSSLLHINQGIKLYGQNTSKCPFVWFFVFLKEINICAEKSTIDFTIVVYTIKGKKNSLPIWPWASIGYCGLTTT